MPDRRESIPRRDRRDRRRSDRRYDSRIPVEAGIRFLRAGTSIDNVLHGELIDVSTTGIRIILDSPLPSAESLLVEVRDRKNHCFNRTARAIWTEALSDGRYQVGCELSVDLSEKQIAVMKELAAQPCSG